MPDIDPVTGHPHPSHLGHPSVAPDEARTVKITTRPAPPVPPSEAATVKIPTPAGGAAGKAPLDPTTSVVAQLGGVSGMVYSALPVVAFVVANALVALPVAIGIAIAIAVVITAWRRYRGEPWVQAAGGLIGVAVAGGIAAWTGSAGGYFLVGIWISAVAAVGVLVTLVVRRPVTGLLWNVLHGNRHAWREDRPTLLAHDVATGVLAVLFAARAVVQGLLYGADATGWLAFARIAMGTPLLALALLVAFWAFRRSTRRLVTNRA